MITTHPLPGVPAPSVRALRGIARSLGAVAGIKRRPIEIVATASVDGSVWVGNSYAAVRLAADHPAFEAARAITTVTEPPDVDPTWALLPLSGPFRVDVDRAGRRAITAESFEKVAHVADATPARMGDAEEFDDVGPVVPVTDGTDTAWVNATLAELLRSMNGAVYIASPSRPVAVFAEGGYPLAVGMPIRVPDAA